MKKRLDGQMIQEAYTRIRDFAYKTPLEKSLYLSNHNYNVYLKMENNQSVKAFKIRGALNKILSLSEEERGKGVGTTSSGNHGISVSYGAKLTGVANAVVIVPKSTPESKVEKIKYFGGTVIVEGDNYDDAHRYGLEYIKENSLTFIDGWDNDEMIYAGQGTVGLEIMEQNPEIDTILVPIGGGGLATGVAVAAKSINPNVRVIGVQTEACPAYVASIQENKLYGEYPTEDSICEALVGGIGQLAFEMKDCIDEVLVVSEEHIKKAIVHLMKNEKSIAEPSGAITTAAILEHGHKMTGKNIAAVVSGGNIDNQLMIDLLNNY